MDGNGEFCRRSFVQVLMGEVIRLVKDSWPQNVSPQQTDPGNDRTPCQDRLLTPSPRC